MCPLDLPQDWVAVIDDDQSVRCSLVRLLRGQGIPAESFGSAEEFLDRSFLGQPCCVVLDVQLGGMSGFELQDELQSRGDATPVIFMTAHDDIAFFHLPCRSGAYGYLRKPFCADALLALVRPLMRQGRLERPHA